MKRLLSPPTKATNPHESFLRSSARRGWAATKKRAYSPRAPLSAPIRWGFPVCVLIRRETGVSLLVSGADLADGTPIYDIKPYLPSADKIENASGGFSEKTTAYALRVDFPERLLEKIPAEKRDGLIDCLKDDPRPAYQSDPERIYGMRFASFNVRFKIADGTLFVIDVAAD